MVFAWNNPVNMWGYSGTCYLQWHICRKSLPKCFGKKHEGTGSLQLQYYSKYSTKKFKETENSVVLGIPRGKGFRQFLVIRRTTAVFSIPTEGLVLGLFSLNVVGIITTYVHPAWT